MLDLLKKHFGYDEFRPKQAEIIATVLRGGDALVLMPTGGGKSLCYQLPALKLPGLTLVVSPLISLMKDQVDALKANGIAAEFLNSSLSPEEAGRIQDRAEAGEIKILYAAPERLALPAFQIFLRSLELSLIAIDEAHCISEWGHDFRPDYRNLRILRRTYPAVPVIALTATATEKVRADIIGQLDLERAEIFITGFNRPNLSYAVVPKRRAFEKLMGLLTEHKGESVIIYCFSRKETERLADDLRAEGHSALPYHAGLDPAKRRQTQKNFIRDQINIITATIAFGMGIDKSNVRLVVHYSLPKSIEGYYQETGRAGRDGLKSRCILFYSYGDTQKHELFHSDISDPGELANARLKLKQMVDYCEADTCRRAYLLSYFGEAAGHSGNCQSCDICLAPKEDFDATVIAQKILSAIIRTGGRFGSNHIIDVLRGSRRQRIKELGHDRLSVFGLAKEFSADELKHIFRQLVRLKLIAQLPGEFPVFGVSEAGKKFLNEQRSLTLPRFKTEPATDKVAGEAEDHDGELFEKLRGLRRELADQAGVPAFVIFSDAALQEMARYFPQSPDSFAQMSGVGAEKLKRFGAPFVELIGAYCRERGLKEIPKAVKRTRGERAVLASGSTYEETGKLIREKLPFTEIMERRGLAASTIVGHIEKLRAAGEELDIDYLKPPAGRFEPIRKAFLKSGQSMLAPVRELLGEDYSYDEIRFARLFL